MINNIKKLRNTNIYNFTKFRIDFAMKFITQICNFKIFICKIIITLQLIFYSKKYIMLEEVMQILINKYFRVKLMT